MFPVNRSETMTTLWKWLAVAGCGVGLLVATDRLRIVQADDPAPVYEQSGGGDSLDRMEHAGPHPHGRPPHDMPPREHRHHPGPGPMRGEIPPEMKDRMEKARARFKEMEERIEKLEAEVAELKAGK
jgi:hypothetical protein